jgi:hypothetical protein
VPASEVFSSNRPAELPAPHPYEGLDNGFLSCAEPVKLAKSCDARGPEEIERVVHPSLHINYKNIDLTQPCKKRCGCRGRQNITTLKFGKRLANPS